MYSHDSTGLGHTFRTLMIASHLAESLTNCSILVLTDLSIIGRFKFPHVEALELLHHLALGESTAVIIKHWLG